MIEPLQCFFVLSGLCALACLLRAHRRQLAAAQLNFRAIRRTNELAKALEEVVQALRDATYKHQKRIAAFHRQLEFKTSVELSDVEQVVQSSHELVSDLVLSQGRISEQLGRLKELTQSRTDYLTGVSNRQSFDEELNCLLTRSRETGAELALAMVDIDRFKAVNDTHGHPVGDQVLRQIVGVMAAHVRHSDSLSRIGGEEFAILMPRNDRVGALCVVERIREAVAASLLQVGDCQVRVTISAGIVIATPGELAKSLISRADLMLYRAKANGRNQTCVDEASPEIRHAVAKNQRSAEEPTGRDPAPAIPSAGATHSPTPACCPVGAA